MMVFSENSEITLVVTSCGRFDLLKRTLETFDRFNTAPIRHVLITEDSGDEQVRTCIPEHWQAHTRFIVNNPKLGQMRSVDAAYALIETQWVFHCEDDWDFYRPGFIEESMTLLVNDPQALQVWLRSFNHDLMVHSPYVFLNEREVVQGIPFYKLGSHKAEWQGFSFNPGLRRLTDYKEHAPYADHGGEKKLSQVYASQNRYALILENDAVLHTGFGSHVVVSQERVDKQRRKRRERAKLFATLVAGLIIGWLLNNVG
ncbi:glycosyltransferase family 2 protein [Pseudomonas syringae]|nr:glycosyltransferase family 2 protein [Pseudomonas syringae]MBD8575607.1 glycosyltransferase family 2 protein [Pseudomonas syringae]MBD8788614.1 glycosyltransferase family 2 protein [Pseudomonas syringae]MBD8801672.1 glycosyltransferase family 2 protein [Pseudomonas syringae]MBD8811383.1 glycosyltransferase family 2 protein [Pseudomonas syringae]